MHTYIKASQVPTPHHRSTTVVVSFSVNNMGSNSTRVHVYPLFFLLVSLLVVGALGNKDAKNVYVVYMGARQTTAGRPATMGHHAMLKDVLGSGAKAKDSLVHSYGRSFQGFAARLSDKEAAEMSKREGVVSVFPNTKLQLHTTRSWEFIGLTQNGTLRSPLEADVIVGLLDTGVWPELDSFTGDNLGPPPSKWKGICQGGTGNNSFTCNNKIIGARFYNSEGIYAPTDFKSPRDSIGHGTHTASTAAGGEAEASYFGLAEGTARGAVPGARIAVYKVCWGEGFCTSADILKAFDDAIADGVDVISVSLGSSIPRQYFQDPIAIGSFHAMRHGVLTSNSAGNSGPFPRTVSNYAPWSLTVAANTIDRKFVAQVALGNGQALTGSSINTFWPWDTEIPLVYGGDAPNVSAGANGQISSFCDTGSLNSLKVSGKIVVCDGITDGSGPMAAEASGMIMRDVGFDQFAFSYPLPATLLDLEDGQRVVDYIHSTSNPFGTIKRGETTDDVMAPVVVSFSSRGPNPITPDVLKPDLTAPGVDILAAWSPVAPPSINRNDRRSVSHNIISGTSMSCPHVSGAAAYVKSMHLDWSPAAIKSALMTTATVMDPRKNPDAEFAYGSGQIDPLKAVTPGLVFDAEESDYVQFLCKQGYNTTTLRLVTGDNSSACLSTTVEKPWDLNYPSFAVSIADGQPVSASFLRTVTNVGNARSIYYAVVSSPPSLMVTVQPAVLRFSSYGEKQSFRVNVAGGAIEQEAIISASIKWTDGRHTVRTPLAVYTVLPPAASDGGPAGVDEAGPFTGGSSSANRKRESFLRN